MDPMTIATAAQAGAGIVQSVVGAFQKGKAKRMARANKRPDYKIAQPVLDNQALIESRASQGLSDDAMQVYKQGAERGLTTSIDAILAGGGSVNNIADLYSNYSDGISKMSLIDEEMRTRNVQKLIEQNNQLAAEKDKEWQVNVYAPYADKAQAAAALSKQGTDNMWKGINSVIGAGTNYATGKMYEKEGNSVFGPKSNTTGGQALPPPNGAMVPSSPWNWYQPESTTPTRPSPVETVQFAFPGLMLGNGGAAAWETGGGGNSEGWGSAGG